MDVSQEVVRHILDHDSHAMTRHYARLSDTTIRRHWEKARKVNAGPPPRRLAPGPRRSSPPSSLSPEARLGAGFQLLLLQLKLH
ncbi:MAG TPA: hypothetical protein VHZ03_48880 [Trebonia sp.]|nr:hypothetical protein [Trebonia sp.]